MENRKLKAHKEERELILAKMCAIDTNHINIDGSLQLYKENLILAAAHAFLSI